MLQIILQFLLPFIFIGCSLFNCVKGSGNVTSESRVLSDFNKINIYANVNLYIRQNDNYSFDIEAEDNIIPHIKTKIKGDELIISTRTCIFNHKPVNIYVSAPEFRRITLSGSGKIISENMLSGDKLDLMLNGSGKIDVELNIYKLYTELTGSGKVYLKGNAYSHKIMLSGSGVINALELETDDTFVNLSGSGICRINSNEKLKINISGSGIVEYTGSPDTQSNVSGSGKIRKLK